MERVRDVKRYVYLFYGKVSFPLEFVFIESMDMFSENLEPELVDCVWLEKHIGIPRYLMYRLMRDCPEIESVGFPRPEKSRFT